MAWITINWLKFASAVGCGILALTFGHAAVYTAKPIGEKPAVVSPEDWEGMWIGRGNANGVAIEIEVVDEDNSVLRAVWIDDLGSGRFELRDHLVYLRESGEWEFFSLEEKEPEESERSERYLWGCLGKREGLIGILLPDTAKFRALIEEEILPGAIDDEEVVLGDLTAEHMELITTSAEGVLFDWGEPLFFLRVGS